MPFVLHGLDEVKERFFAREKQKRELAGLSQAIQTTAKRSIFAVHRDDLETAARLLDEARAAKREAERVCRAEPALEREGVWRAAQEELLEAELLLAMVEGVPATLPENDPDQAIGACSDAIGELVRVLVRDVTRGRLDRVQPLQATAQGLLEFLLAFDATGSARQKVDQARQHVRKLEDIAYDLALRRL